MKTDGLGSVLTDNTIRYINFLNMIILYSDPSADITVNKLHRGIGVYVIPSTNFYKQDIIDNVVFFHKRLFIKPDFAKSTLSMTAISFTIDFEN